MLEGASESEAGELMEELLPYLDGNPNVVAYQAAEGLTEGVFVNADADGLTTAGQKYNEYTADVASFLG